MSVVIPAHAGIQALRTFRAPGLRGGDDGIGCFDGLVAHTPGSVVSFATPAMPTPHLTFFVELPSTELVTLFDRAGVVDFLVAHRCSIAMGLLDLSPERAAVARRLEGLGVPVTGWLLLDVAEGYWLNADNPERAVARYRETIAWAAREGLTLHRIGLDIEFPRADGALLAKEPRRGLLTLLRRRRPAAQVDAAERAYADLVREIRATGRSVETYHFPFMLDERAVGSTLLRRTLGLVDLPADYEVHMLYASYIGRLGARAYFADAPCIALGVTGGGVNAGTAEEVARLLTWPRLEEDLLAAAALTREVYVFSLEGCVEQGWLDRLRALDWSRAALPLTPAEGRRMRRQRRLTRWVLRSELLLDLFLPARAR